MWRYLDGFRDTKRMILSTVCLWRIPTLITAEIIGVSITVSQASAFVQDLQVSIPILEFWQLN